MAAATKKRTRRNGASSNGNGHHAEGHRILKRGASITRGRIQESFDGIRTDYDAAKASRFRKKISGISPMGSGADYHIRNASEYYRIIEWARNFDRNSPIVGQAIDRLVNNVLQGGIRPDPATGSKRLDAELTKRWNEWYGDPGAVDAEGENTGHRIAKLSLRHTLIDGDILHVGNSDGTLRSIEAHRIRSGRSTRNVVHGVLMDDDRRRLEYWITKRDMGVAWGGPPRYSELIPVPVRDANGVRVAFHVYNPKRLSQTRGVSVLAPVFDMLGFHDDLQFANLVKAQVAACVTIFTSRDIAFQGSDEPAYGDEDTQTLDDGTTRTTEGLEPGLHITGQPGENLTAYTPNIPNETFFEHASLVLSIIAVNLNLPVQVLLLDPTKTNFSGWRGAVDQARRGFEEIQEWHKERFYAPIYEWKIRQWLAFDPQLAALAENADPFGVTWTPPSFPYIQPREDALADKEIIQTGLNSRRNVLAKRGLDIDKVDADMVKDRERLIMLAAAAAKKINNKFPGARVDWREIIHGDAKFLAAANTGRRGNAGGGANGGAENNGGNDG